MKKHKYIDYIHNYVNILCFYCKIAKKKNCIISKEPLFEDYEVILLVGALFDLTTPVQNYHFIILKKLNLVQIN